MHRPSFDLLPMPTSDSVPPRYRGNGHRQAFLLSALGNLLRVAVAILTVCVLLVSGLVVSDKKASGQRGQINERLPPYDLEQLEGFLTVQDKGR